MAKYILATASDVDMLEIETDGDRVVNVTTLVPAADGATPDITAAELQSDLSSYLTRPGATIEDALGTWAGGYNSMRRIDDE